MNRIIVQARKEWQDFHRDKLSLALAFILPVFSLFLFGYGIRLESKGIPVAVQNLDSSRISRDYVHHLFNTDRFIPADWSEDNTPDQAIEVGDARVGIIIPPQFGERIAAEQSSPLQVLIDGTDISNAQIVCNTIKAANAEFLKTGEGLSGPVKALIRHGPPVVPSLEIKFNPKLDEALFIVPGVFGVVLWMYPALLAAVAASREKDQETVIHVYSSRLSAVEYLLGKALVYFIVGLCMAALVILLGCLVFRIKPIGDPTPLLLATPIYVLVSVLFGLMLGTFANSQTTAVQATSTAGFFPCLLLSGFVYPIYNIPFPLSLFSLIVPARYYIELSRDGFVRGAGWPAVWQDPVALCLFVLVYFALTWYGTRRMQLKD